MAQWTSTRLFFWPGMKLMRSLPYPLKLAVLIAASSSAILGMTWVAARAAPAESEAWIVVGGGAAWLLTLYLGAAFIRTSLKAMRVLQGSVAQLAAGDFAARIQLPSTDELLTVGNTLDDMTGQISQMISEIRSNSSMVAQTGMRLADNTKALADRTEAQAHNLERTASSVREITQAVTASANSAAAVDGMAAEVRQIAEAGGVAVQSAVKSVEDIQTSSRRVQEIIGVIEGIAFQTNILALNAAVEAARAGEQGRGFAVVASEVRSLAQRSATSAKEIKHLIGESVEHVETGVQQINGTRQTFERIISGIREVADNVRTIAGSSREQSQSLASVAQSVVDLDELTQQNAMMVDEASDASAQLSERARRLAGAVESFRLRQGSADEALALVEKALACYKAQGARALDSITQTPAQFADRDMYVFAFDRAGVYRAFSGNVGKVATNVRNVPGVDGDKLVRDAFERASHGGGWVDYVFANPKTGSVDLKTSYVVPISDDLILGCGVYKSRDESAKAVAS